ncbi:MAG: STAS-like domain-containing protein [Maioricimonas sp. JB049]
MTRRFVIKDELGTDLSSRHSAAALRRAVLSAAECEPVAIDLEGVRTLSDSFADEFFAVIVAEKGEDWFRRSIHVTGLAPQVRRSILEAVRDRLNSQPAQTP